MHGLRLFSLLAICLLAGCAHLPGASSAAVPTITPAMLSRFTVQLADMPMQDRMALDLTPTNDQLAQLLAQPQLATTLAHAGRQGGSYRVFAFAAPEPSVYNVTVRATIQLDVFPNPAQATDWLMARDATLTTAGDVQPVAAPGQNHVARMRVTTTGDIAATTTVLTLRDGNLTMEITTLFVGQGASIADAERYAALIDDRIHGNGTT
jgi:hypothetical protein